MSICILEGQKINEDDSTRAVLYCNTTGTAFGPLFIDADEAEAFLTWWGSQQTSLPDTPIKRRVKIDLRELSAKDLNEALQENDDRVIFCS